MVKIIVLTICREIIRNQGLSYEEHLWKLAKFSRILNQMEFGPYIVLPLVYPLHPIPAFFRVLMSTRGP